jgi:ribulose-phosphate 3-epimerase
MFKIAPSILAADFARLGECIRIVEDAGADLIHIDVMDGHFVPNISVGIPVVESLRKCTALPLDVHLMIEHPDRFVMDFIHAGANMVSVHIEAEKHLHRTVHLIKDNGASAGVVLNPATMIELLDPLLQDLDFVLIMSVNPGFGAQKFIPSCLARIRALKERVEARAPHVQIEVDGGINEGNYRDVVLAGTDILVAGSSVFNNPDPGGVIRRWSEFKMMSSRNSANI